VIGVSQAHGELVSIGTSSGDELEAIRGDRRPHNRFSFVLSADGAEIPILVVLEMRGTEERTGDALTVHRDGQREEIASLILQDPCAGERRFLPLAARARTDNGDANHNREQATCVLHPHGRPYADRTRAAA
jgi:hypothetical protein